MTKIPELIENLKAQGIELSLAGENLRYRGPSEALSRDHRRDRKHKADIVDYLKTQSEEPSESKKEALEISHKSTGPVEQASWLEMKL